METSVEKLLPLLERQGISLGAYTLREESEVRGEAAAKEQMREALRVMRRTISEARRHPVFSVSGLSGGSAHRYSQYLAQDTSLLGGTMGEAVAMALSVSEVNASMGKIVACPTAGSCGIVPAALLSVGESRGKSEEELVDALFTAAGIGILIGERATLAGAEGGCQAECGSASAMGAAGVVEMMGGSPRAAFHAASMTIKNVMGLVCDPVCGLVEIPCVKRNASGVANALVCADLALAGVESHIPFDEVVDAMYRVGRGLPKELRETALGGLAATPTAKRLEKQLRSVSRAER